MAEVWWHRIMLRLPGCSMPGGFQRSIRGPATLSAVAVVCLLYCAANEVLIEAPSTHEADLRNHSVDIKVPGTSCVPATTISFQATNKLHCIASGDEQACYPIHCRVRDMEKKKSMTPSSSFDPKASIIDMALPIGSDTQNVSTARTVIIAETGAAKTIPIENFIVSPGRTAGERAQSDPVDCQVCW